MAKLTLNVEPDLVLSAKAYAAARGTSVSKLVSRFFASLGEHEADAFFSEMRKELLDEGYEAPPADIAALRDAHTAEKYL